MDANGEPIDWPGWVLNSSGFWVPDPTDAAWRDGLTLVAEINGETATASVTYPPETATCSANAPEQPVPTTASTVPGGSTPPPSTPSPSTPQVRPAGTDPHSRGTLPVTGADILWLTAIGLSSLLLGTWLRRQERRANS